MRHTMLRYRVLVGFVIGVGLSLGLFLASVPAENPSATDTAADWRTIAMTLAINGRFDSSLERFRQASTLDSDDESLSASVKLLSNYMLVRADMDKGRIRIYL